MIGIVQQMTWVRLIRLNSSSADTGLLLTSVISQLVEEKLWAPAGCLCQYMRETNWEGKWAETDKAHDDVILTPQPKFDWAQTHLSTFYLHDLN